MKTWRIVLLALSAMLLVVSVALLVSASTGATWDQAAGWIEAFATTAALGAALAAALLVGRTVQIELDREGQRLVTDQQAQALLVAAWVTGHNSGSSVDHVGDSGKVEKVPAVSQMQLAYLNGSPVPIYDAELTIEFDILGLDQKTRIRHGRASTQYLVIPPSDAPVRDWVEFDPPFAYPIPPHEGSYEVRATIAFTDAANRRWKRSPSGLEELS